MGEVVEEEVVEEEEVPRPLVVMVAKVQLRGRSVPLCPRLVRPEPGVEVQEQPHIFALGVLEEEELLLEESLLSLSLLP